jgi:hypothetical protein
MEEEVHDGLPGKLTATDQYPTEQRGVSNIQVNGNANMSGPMPFGALDTASALTSAVTTFSRCRLPLPLTWILDIPCCSVGYSPYMPLPTNPS